MCAAQGAPCKRAGCEESALGGSRCAGACRCRAAVLRCCPDALAATTTEAVGKLLGFRHTARHRLRCADAVSVAPPSGTCEVGRGHGCGQRTRERRMEESQTSQRQEAAQLPCRADASVKSKEGEGAMHDASAEHEETVWISVILASCGTFSMGGVVFGISSLYPMLYQQGFSRASCASATPATCPVGMRTKCCEHQFLAFSLLSSSAFFLVDAAAAPWGELADRLGGRVCFGFGVCSSVAGFFMLAAGNLLRSDTLTAAAVMILGMAGPGAFNGGFFGTLELIGDSNPRAKATLTSLNAAAFDGSALVLMLFHSCGSLLGVELWVPAMAWGVLCLVMGVFLFCQLPRRVRESQPSSEGAEGFSEAGVPSVQREWRGGSDSSATEVVREVEEDGREEHLMVDEVPLLSCNSSQATWPPPLFPSARELRRRHLPALGSWSQGVARGHSSRRSGKEGAKRTLSPSSQRRKDWPVVSAVLGRTNILLVLFMAVYHLVSNFYLETQIDQFERLFGGEVSVQFSTAFNFVFPVGGFCVSIPVASLLRKTEDAEHLYFGIVFAVSNVFSILSLSSLKTAQVLAALLFGPVRCLTWASYFQFLATERRYLPELSARAMGYNNVFIAVAGAMGPYLLAHLVSLGGASADGEDDDAAGTGRYLVAKSCLQLINLLSGIFPWLLWREHRQSWRGK
ncbi:hypothetical protein AB1Y20_013536 [Prymnesium parvum]|uniref:Uncharacterized protein n=1 Tax=Prymnesium parvum TaxID=97485 RepID=A0AB34IG47_PRYPA